MEVKILTHLYRQNMATSFRILGHHRVARARTSMQQQHWRSVRLKMKKSRQIGDRLYPRVKAKDKIFNCNQSGSCLNSNYLQSRASENKQEEDLHIIVAKIPKIYIPSVFMSESESKDMKKHIRGAEIEKKRRGAEIEPIQKPKTIPVLRPRAVVSSPAWDGSGYPENSGYPNPNPDPDSDSSDP
uniref:Uncharacterized protein n=1 Tax=Brassica oleracea var. oleracea TaxID=109376 RepID=A0A0D3BKU8_BRAOL